MSILTCFNHDCFSSNRTYNASILTQSQCYLMDSNAEIKGRLRFQQKGDWIEVEVMQRSPAEVMGEAMRTAFETIASNCSSIANKCASIVKKCGSIANNPSSMFNKCGSIASNYFSSFNKYGSIVSNNLTSFKKCVPVANNLVLFVNNSCSSSDLSKRLGDVKDLIEEVKSKSKSEEDEDWCCKYYNQIKGAIYILGGIVFGVIGFCMDRDDKVNTDATAKKNEPDLPATSAITVQPKCSNNLDQETTEPFSRIRANKSILVENS